MANLIPDEEREHLAEEYHTEVSNVCKVCGNLIVVQIFKNTGVCSDNHRKIRDGDDPSAYPFAGNPVTGAP